MGRGPITLVTGDFNGDGRTDLAVANYDDNDVSVLLGKGDGTFVAPGQFATTPRATPLVADVNGDGTADVLVVDGAGNILYRQGIPRKPGTFEPPVTVNPGTPSRDIAWVPDTNQGPVLASVDAHDNAISLYAYRDGRFVKVGSLATGSCRRRSSRPISTATAGPTWSSATPATARCRSSSLSLTRSLVPSIPRSTFRPSSRR